MSAITFFLLFGLTTLYKAIKQFLPVFIIIILFIIVKVVYRAKKYGNKEYKLYTVNNINNYKSTIIKNYLSKISNSKLLITNTLNSKYLLLTHNMIYLIYLYQETGYIYGSIDGLTLNKKINDLKNKPVENPYLLLNQDEKQIKSIIKNVNIKKFIIIDNNCSIIKSDSNNFQTIKFKMFFDVFRKIMKEDNLKYDKNNHEKYQDKLISL